MNLEDAIGRVMGASPEGMSAPQALAAIREGARAARHFARKNEWPKRVSTSAWHAIRALPLSELVRWAQ